MRITHALLAIFLAVALIGCRTAPTRVVVQRDFNGVPTTEFTITVSGTPGIAFTGTITTDGEVTKTEGRIPATFRVSAHDLAVAFKKTSAGGSIALHVDANGKGQGESSTSRRFGGVRAQLLCTPMPERVLFTTY